MPLSVAQPTAGILPIIGAYIIGTLDDSGNFVQYTGGDGSPQSLDEVLAVGNDANALNIINLADPVNPQDAMTLNYWTNNAAPLAIADKNGLEIDTNYLLNTGVGDNLTVTAGLLETPVLLSTWFENGYGSIQRFAFDTNISSDEGGNLTTNSINTGNIEFTSITGMLDAGTVNGNTLSNYFANSNADTIQGFAFDANISSDDSGNLTASSFSGVGTSLTGLTVSQFGISPVADGTYTMGLGVTTNGTITTQSGIITAVTQAS